MITLNVLSVNGNTALANANYPVGESNFLWAYANPSNSNQTIVEIEGVSSRKRLLVSATLANTLTALNAGAQQEIFLSLNDVSQNRSEKERTMVLTMDKIVTAYDGSEGLVIQYVGRTIKDTSLVARTDAVSDITTAAADITPGAETIAYPFSSKSVLAINGKRLPANKTILINQKYVNAEYTEPQTVKDTATARAILKAESILAITTGGSQYEINDVLTLVGGIGTKATFTVSKVAPIDGQDQTDYDNVGDNGTFAGGTGHAIADELTMDDGTVVTVVDVAAGVITEFTVDSSGSTGNTVNDDVLTQSSSTGVGINFTLTQDKKNQRVHTVTLTTAGKYSVLMDDITAIDTTVGSGTGSGAQLSLDFEVDSLAVVNPGSGYGSNPAVTISGGGGTGATGTSTATAGKITALAVGAAGNNFTSIPTVSIAAPGDHTAWKVVKPGYGTKTYIF